MTAPALAAVAIHGTPVPITADAGVTPHELELALASVPFADWRSDLDPAIAVTALHVQSVDLFGSRMGFMKFKATATLHGRPIPGIVFLRGGAVAILVILQCDGERWALCCRQPRVPCGSSGFLEIPAGMLDGSGHFAGVAAKELREETGIDITDDAVTDLTALAYGGTGGSAATASAGDGGSADAGAGAGASAGAVRLSPGSDRPVRGVYPSVGACDEFLRLMLYRQTMTRPELEALRGKATGCLEEGEQITLELVRYEDLWRHAPDGKTLAAVLLYERCLAAGLVPADE